MKLHKLHLTVLDEYAMKSLCLKRQVGALLIDKTTGNIKAAGFNRVPKDMKDCVNCLRQNTKEGKKYESCYAIHAEQAVIFNYLEKYNEFNTLKNNILVCTYLPCSMCMKWIIECGIKEVIYLYEYNDKLTLNLAKSANVKLIKGGE